MDTTQHTISPDPLLQGEFMVIHLDPELEAVLAESARRQGMTPEDLARTILRERFLSPPDPGQPRDEWENRLIGAASNCGVSLPDSALSSEGLYE
jgi:hypothetical protein